MFSVANCENVALSNVMDDEYFRRRLAIMTAHQNCQKNVRFMGLLRFLTVTR